MEDDAWSLLNNKLLKLPYGEPGARSAWKRSLKSPYLFSNFVYMIYAALILTIDMHKDEWSMETINHVFIVAAVVHVVNACMYIWVWMDSGYPFRHRVMIPELLNIAESSLYLVSASMYSFENADGDNMAHMDPVLRRVQRIELVAAILELMAAFGWVITWYMTYPRAPGRGWTLDDPDIWANVTIVTPGIIYVVYNIQEHLYPESYGGNLLYITADKIYMANAILYFIVALRDVGWFWYMPTAGRFPKSALDQSVNTASA